MPQKVGTVTTELQLDTRTALQQYNRFQQTIQKGTRGRDSIFGSISADAREFDTSLGKATNRVVAFGAAAAVFGVLAKATYAFAESIVEVDKSLAAINVNLGQSQEGLKKFGADLFNVARQTGQTFEIAAGAAAELARQGLSAEETTKRLKDALILSRIAGLDSADAVQTLTAAINSFNQEALTSTEVINKFAAVDTKFAVSSKDLAEAVSRVGSTSQAAGVGIDELIGLITSLQQTTARGGATIGNGLKSIFTRIQAAPETVNALQGIGVAIKNTDGSLRSAVSILKDYAVARQKVGEVERQALDRTVAGTFQINTLKALLGDLSKQYSIYGSAVRTSVGATDEAIRKNEQLNQTISSLLNSTSLSIKQLFASIGDQSLGPVFKELLRGLEEVRSFFSGDSGSEIGKSLGEGILKGISNVLSGPGLLALGIVLVGAFKKVLSTILQEAQTLLTINGSLQARANIQKQINNLLGQATQAELAQYQAANSVLAKKEQILAIEARINQERLLGNPVANSLLTPGRLGVGFSKDSRLKGGYLGGPFPTVSDPIASAIAREQKASGLPTNQIYVDRDSRVSSFANPLGILVANRRDEPLGGYQGVNRVIGEGGNPKTNGIPGFAKIPNFDGADDLKKFFALMGSKVGADFRAATAERLAKGEEVKFTKPAAIKLARVDPHYVLKENPDGTVSVLRVLTSQEVAASQATLSKINKAPIRGPGGRFVSPENVPAAILRANEQGSRLIETGGRQAANDYNAQLARRNPLPQRIQSSFPSLAGDELINRQVQYDVDNPQPFGLYNDSGAYSSPIGPSYKDYRRQQLIRQGQRQRRKAAIKAQALETNRTRALGLSFLAPFAAGFVDPTLKDLGVNTSGGTLGGKFSGAVQGAGQGATLGVFGPQAAAVGVALGALIGFISKSSQSLEEFNEIIDKGVAIQNASVDAAQRVVAFNENIAQGGLTPSAHVRLRQQKAEALLNVDPEFRDRLSKSNLSQDDAGKILGEIAEKADRVTRVGEVQKSSRALSQGSLLDRANRYGGASLGPIGALHALFSDPLDGINQAREIGKNASGLVTKQNVGSIDESVLNRIIGGKSEGADLDKLNAIYQKLGAATEITADKQVEFAEALKTAKTRFNKYSALIAQLEKEALNGRLSKNAFISAPNLDVYRQAALTGRNPRASNGDRAQSQYDFYQELINTKAVNEEVLEIDPEYKKARAGVQLKNVANAGISYLKAKNYDVGKLTNNLGDPNIESIIRQLEFSSKSGTRDSGNASYLLKYLKEGRATASDAKINNPSYSPAFGSSDSGIAPGGKYEVTAGNALKAAQESVRKTLESANATVIRSQLSVDGTIRILSSDVLSSESLQKIASEMTAAIGKQFQAQISDLNIRLSKAEGNPVPPTVIPTKEAFGNNLVKGSDGFIRSK